VSKWDPPLLSNLVSLYTMIICVHH
jgi:hypothetical protein